MLTSILRLICKLLFKVQVRGLENVPVENGLLIVANHESFLDGFLLGLFLPKRATFIVHTTVLRSWWFRQFFTLNALFGSRSQLALCHEESHPFVGF